MSVTEDRDARRKAARREYVKSFREKRIANKLCVNCGKPLDREGRTTCIACGKKMSRRETDRRAFMLSMHVCPMCGINDLFGEEKLCPECKAKIANRRDNDESRRKEREQKRKERERKKELGQCMWCSNDANGHALCEKCRQKDWRRHRAKQGANKKAERASQLLCVFCGEPVKEGFKLCEKHYAKAAEVCRRNRAEGKISSKGHPWGKPSNGVKIMDYSKF